jgi:hypothetical protein
VRFEDFEASREARFRVITSMGEAKAVFLASRRLAELDRTFIAFSVVVSDLGEFLEDTEEDDLIDRMEW